MSDRIGNLSVKPREHMAIVAAALLTIIVATEFAWPKATPHPAPSEQGAPAQPAPEQNAPAPPDPAPPKENPGLINEIGKLLEKPASMLPTLKSPRETIDDAADALSRLTKSPGVKSPPPFPGAPNGRPGGT